MAEEFVDDEMSVVGVDCVVQELDVVSKDIECSKAWRESDEEVVA